MNPSSRRRHISALMHPTSLLHILLIVLLLHPLFTLSQAHQIRGVRKRDQAKYTGATFSCFDGSASFPSTVVNDDYCDCADSSDEPGTSACPASSFFCPNKGATSLTLPSSRVNDLICDCCDGSDEWNGNKEGGCPNTCAELGRALHQHVLEEIAATAEGVKIRQQWIEETKKLKAEKEAKKAVYEAKLAERQKALDEAKAAQAAEEALEQAEKDRLKAIEDAIAAEKAAQEAAQQQQQSEQQDQQDDPEFLKLAQQTEEQTTEVPADQQQEAGPPLGNTETPDAAQPDAAPAESFPYPAEYAYKPDDQPTTHHSTPGAASEVIEQEIENFPYPAQYAYHAEDGSHTHAADGTEIPSIVEGDEEEELPTLAGVVPPPSPSPATTDAAPATEAPAVTSASFTLEGEATLTRTSTWSGVMWERMGRMRASVEAALFPVHPLVWETLEFYAQCWAYLKNTLFPQPQSPAQAAEKAREVTRAAQAKVDRTQSKLTELSKWLTSDFGPDLAFATLSGQCFTYTHAQYTYEMCPYGDANQKEGGGSTKLGGWEGWKVREDGVQVLNFVNGQTCWQGPARSLTVLMRCGVKNEIKGVEEPSRCVYEMEFTTPVVCNEEHAKKLQQDLDDQATAEEE